MPPLQQIAWITDPHLNFLPPAGPRAFGEYVKQDCNPSSVLITGDVSEYPTLKQNLKDFAEGVGTKVYFVLGNHDYYKGSFALADNACNELMEEDDRLHWLSAGAVGLSADTCLLGQDGFYDARCGLGPETRLRMADFDLIRDFVDRVPRDASGGGVFYMPKEHDERIAIMRWRADEEAKKAEPRLEQAAQQYKNVWFATHYPPFEKACFHEGAVSDVHWLPYFTSVVMGRVLQRVAKRYPDVKFTVFCGHTHSPGTLRVAHNLTVHTGASEYYAPRVHRLLPVP